MQLEVLHYQKILLSCVNQPPICVPFLAVVSLMQAFLSHMKTDGENDFEKLHFMLSFFPFVHRPWSW